MKIKYALIALCLAVSVPVLAAEESSQPDADSGMTSNGGSAKMRNIDSCVRGDFNGSVVTYDYGYNGKACTMADAKYRDKPVPEQQFKTPFR